MKPIRYSEDLINDYIARGWWNKETWSDIYARNAQQYSEREAFVDEKKIVTWREIGEIIDRLSLWFIERSFNRGDRVFCQLPPCIENVAVGISLEKAGLVHVYSPPTQREAEIAYFVEELEPVAAVITKEYHGYELYKALNNMRRSGKYPYLRDILVAGEEVPNDAISIRDILMTPFEQKYLANWSSATKLDPINEISCIKATTGTTGKPKLAVYNASSCKCIGYTIVQVYGFTKDDIVFTAVPPWPGVGMLPTYSMPLVGGKAIYMDYHNNPEGTLKMIEKERPTFVSAFPPQLIAMARHSNFRKYDVSSIRMIGYSGAPLPAGVASEIQEKFRAPIFGFYGAIDGGGTFFVRKDASPDVRLGSIGKVDPFSECKIVNEIGEEVAHGQVGEIYVRGACSCGGYYNDEEATKANWTSLDKESWYKTGDVGYMDKEGNVWLAGRKKEMILRGGQNIYPAEIEAILNEHPKILHVAIVPMPDDRLGERACAFVVLKEVATFTFDEMISYLSEKRLAKYKFPERLEILDGFPMVASKFDKRALATIVANKLLSEGIISKSIFEDFRDKGKIK